MKRALLANVFCILCVGLTGCAAAQKPAPTVKAASVRSSSAALTSASLSSETSASEEKTAAEAWAEKKAVAEAEAVKQQPRESGDPLAMNSEIEESSIPKTDITPTNQVRRKSPGELNAAMGIVKSATSVEGAAQKLTQKLGKPSWTESPKGAENAKRRIWVAPSGGQCHRLVLEPDGSVDLETVSKNEWRMLAASARQNPCSGEIKRGITNK